MLKERIASRLKEMTPGQAVVLYDEDIVVGGGTILKAI